MEHELAGLAFIAPNFTLSKFNGGTVNSSYKLDSAGKNYFVKTFESDQVIVLNRKKLFDIQQQLANQNLSVQPIYLSEFQHFQIDTWLDEPTLDKTDLSDLAISKQLASTLANIHAIKIEAPVLDLPKQWQHYIEQTQDHFETPSSQSLEQMSIVWERSCAECSVFCHNDLAISHVTLSQPNKVFDWEYCSLSSPYFDIASCIAVNGLSATDQASLCAYYANYTDKQLADITMKVNQMKPLVEFTYKLWYQSATLVG
jgi:thiamine kinase-like enzyme